jgi:hypothetical protein
MKRRGKGKGGTDGEIGGFWFGQPEYVEVWQEKTDLTDAFNSLLSDLYVRLRSNKGYSSLAFLHQSIEGLKAVIEEKEMKPNDVYILYCGDWDPSGENIDYYIQRRIVQRGLTGIHFVRVAVTPEQIDGYHLPLLPIERKEDKKADNPNMKEFIRRHGLKATHLNAFFTEAKLPEFKRIIVDAVKEHWYQEIYDIMVEVYDVPAPAPDNLTDDELREARKEMYTKITKAFEPGWWEGLPDAPDAPDQDEDDNGSINDDADVNEDEGAQ